MRRDAFVGRQEELRALGARHRDGARLISIIASGGVGKTTLARRLAAGEAGAVFIDLTEARSVHDVLRIAAGALQVSLASTSTAEEAVAAIGRDLAARESPLVVLDNFEQVLAAAPAVIAWVDAAPALRVLVTSRERLRLVGEEIFQLQPFSTDPEPSFTSEAVELFVLRAEAIGATLPRDRETMMLIGSIARRLDGIPLAIELAAARANILGPRQILERLERGLPDLGRAARDEDERHTTMRAAIAWSWELLDANERSALAQASVFRAGFSADAAEAVILIDQPVLDVLARLVEKCLLNSGPSPGFANEVRLGMFTTVRDFAHEKLGDAQRAAWRRHALYTLELTEEWGSRVHSVQGTELLARLALEEENLLAVVDRSRRPNNERARDEEGSSALELRALLALEPVRTGQAPGPYLAALDEAIAGIDDALERGSPELVASALLARAQCKRWAGRTAQSVADLDRSIAIARAGGCARSELKALRVLGMLHTVADRIGEGLAAFARATQLADGCGESRLAARIRLDVRTTEHRAGRLSGLDAIVPVLPLFEAEGDVEALAHARTRLGMFLVDDARYAEARAALEASLAFFRERRDRKREAWLQRTIASLDHTELDLAEAERNARQALAIETTMGLGYGVANGRLVLGSVLLEAGRVREAEHELRAAADGLRALNDGRHAGVALARLGTAHARAGDAVAAERAFVEAETALAPLHDARLGSVLEIERGQLDLLRARLALEAGSLAAAGDHIEAARRRLSVASTPVTAALKTETLTEAVIATRALRAALAELSPPTEALAIAEDGSWFRSPHGKHVDIGNRPTLARVLKALLAARLDAPGVALGVGLLTKAGWPDQAVIASAAQNRINVALTTLRKLGLGELVLRVDDGWLLDPKVPVVRLARSVARAF